MFEIFAYIALLIPGIIPAFIDGIYGSGRGFRLINSIVVAFLMTTFSYLTLAGIYSYYDIEFPLSLFVFKQQSIFDSMLFTEEISVLDNWREITLATLIALVYLAIWLPVVRNQWIGQMLQTLKLTDYSGALDVWSEQSRIALKRRSFVQVIDNNNGRYYTGWFNGYSSYDNFRELILLNIEIHDLKFNLIAVAPIAYVGLPNDNVTILYFNKEWRIRNDLVRQTAQKSI